MEDLCFPQRVSGLVEDAVDPLGEDVEVLLVDRCRQRRLEGFQQLAARVVGPC
jgi:hypothetical protein